jgi:hypothetical protein
MEKLQMLKDRSTTLLLRTFCIVNHSNWTLDDDPVFIHGLVKVRMKFLLLLPPVDTRLAPQ